MSHIVESCPLTKLNGGLSRLHSVNEDAVSWLTSYGSWHAYEKKKIIIITIDMLNPLDYKGNYSATSNNTKLVHWPLMGGLLHLVQWRGDWAGCGPAQSPPRCTKCNSPPINGQCTNHCIAIWWSVALRFNVAIKGLTWPKYCQLLQGPHEMPEKTTTIIITTNNNMK